MDELSRGTDEVIMHVRNVLRFTDPIFRLEAVGAIKLLQFFARMVKEHRLKENTFDDFATFLKATDGKYNIMNVPLVEEGKFRAEMEQMDIHYMILPDLNKDDGLMQIAVYEPDREKFGAWYERFLTDRMQGGEKGLRELQGLTRGNVSIVSFPLEGREEGMKEDFESLGINFARLPDLRVGDGSIQFEIANSDMKKVTEWYKLKQQDLLKEGEIAPDYHTISEQEYQQTGEMTDQEYLENADETYQKANEKYQGREQGELERQVISKDAQPKEPSTSSFERYRQDPDFIPVSINRETLIDQSVISNQMREKFWEKGQFICRVPGTWEGENRKETMLVIPRKQVFKADEGQTFLAFLDRRHLPMLLYAGSGQMAREFFGMDAKTLADTIFHKIEKDDLTERRLMDRGKSLAEAAEKGIRAPAPPVKVR
ncbi:MAG: hypothetical protein U0K57_00025 [Lachnospiraceae bacterium]|nr:hypothetical protein [Lachnospiraceae bacterium]